MGVCDLQAAFAGGAPVRVLEESTAVKMYRTVLVRAIILEIVIFRSNKMQKSHNIT
jgi:hypothetical protein